MASAVLIPVKSFDLAKKRLGASLTGSQRAELARSMTRQVVAAASPLPAYIVCGSAEVAAWATSIGTNVIWFVPAGLNQAVSFGVDRLAADGFASVIVAHGDLPLARSLPWVSDFDGVSIVTDRRGEGTNVLSVPTGGGFKFQYGETSAADHQAEAKRIGLDLRLLDDPELGWDVDVPGDLINLPDQAIQTAKPGAATR